MRFGVACRWWSPRAALGEVRSQRDAMASSPSPGQQTTAPPTPPPDYAPAEPPTPDPAVTRAESPPGAADDRSPSAAASPAFVFVGDPDATDRASKSDAGTAGDAASSSVALGSPPAVSLESVPAHSVDSVPAFSVESAADPLADIVLADSVDSLPAASLDCDPAVAAACTPAAITDAGSADGKSDFLSSCLCLFECKFGICKLIQYCKCFRR